MAKTVADKLGTPKKGSRSAVKQVRLNLVYVDFWSAVKFSFLLSLCWGIVTIVTSLLVYFVVLQTGVFDTVNSLLGDVAGGDISLTDYVNLPQVFMLALISAVLNTIVGTALGGVAALVYNMVVRVAGGFKLGFTSGN